MPNLVSEKVLSSQELAEEDLGWQALQARTRIENEDDAPDRFLQ